MGWKIQQSGEAHSLKLEWRESGGPPAESPARKGFGSTLIEHSLRQVQAQSCFEFRPEGVICSLEMKL